ncbi:putative nucleic acid-binding Zn-ribbon protein [Sporomusaceae bacterium BoRhaA]|jgi:hypothetical protein|nr:hypothetical protein [Pelorhabdus rhamnosifermentans]MBU2703743.1 putative nucleic acid-binding Zn-ribbon protein [Pelorhabdus rhamnosifermentans]
MIKLQCTQCGEIWYTASTLPNQTCDTCGGVLVEITKEVSD